MFKLIVGLGNPGDLYKNNRHNVGFKVIDSLAKKFNIELDKQKFSGEYGVFLHNEVKIVLAKPLNYMNLSGDFVNKFMQYYNIDLDDLIVIYDDVDIQLGEFKLRTSGSSGGQNGVKDIISKLNSDQFKRIKIGIGPKDSKIPLANFVLSNFDKFELEKISKIINLIGKIIENVDKASFSNLLDYVTRNK